MLVAALLLGGCGRKGQLEPPPSAQLVAPAAVQPTDDTTETSPLFAPPSSILGQPESSAPKQPPAMDRQGQPIAPPGPKRHIFLDNLID
jgi:predicted small lipoprotein YifL